MNEKIKIVLKQALKTFLYIVGVVGIVLLTEFTTIKIKDNRYSYNVFRDRIELAYYGSKDKLTTAVDEYIQSVAPNSALNGLAIVNACEEEDVDIIFVLSQGQVESHFGTQGVAAKTNSVFNVMAVDGRSAEEINRRGHGFSHPDLSVKPYLQLIKKYYLTGDKTEMALLDKYVSSSGQRYASSTSYEAALKTTYANITSTTQIDSLQMVFKNYKMLSGK